MESRGSAPSLTLEKLREPHGSVPHNPLLVEPLYLLNYIERMGTGTRDMIRRSREAGLTEPDFGVRDGFVAAVSRKPANEPTAIRDAQGAGVFVTPPVTRPVTPPVEVLLRLLASEPELSAADIRARLGLKDRTHARERYLDAALAAGVIEPTIPDKPNSRLQKYRLTNRGSAVLAQLKTPPP